MKRFKDDCDIILYFLSQWLRLWYPKNLKKMQTGDIALFELKKHKQQQQTFK